MGQKKMIRFTKLLLDTLFYVGIMALLTLPWTLKLITVYYSEMIGEHYLSMLVIFGSSAFMGILIINELRHMMKTVREENCFVNGNVKSLNHMVGISLVISAIYAIKMLILPTPATVIIAIVFFVAALFSGVLAQVFAEAIRYKEENDLTI